MTTSDRIRQYVVEKYITPATSHGEGSVRVVSGDVHKALGLSNRIAQVCAALRSKKLLQGNALKLKSVKGPPSGMSTTVVYEYELTAGTQGPRSRHPFWSLRGIAKNAFRELGGAEAFLQSERQNFFGPRG
jgi:hypothetical protein